MIDNPAFQTEFTKGMVQLMLECVAPIKKENEFLKKEIEELKSRELKHGKDGKDADPVEVAKIILQSIQLPKDGKDGKNGQDAQPVDVDDIVSRVVAMVPAPKDGAAGKDGVDGKDGAPGSAGKDGEKGKDGISPDVTEVAALIMKSIQLPKDGKDGRDGTDGQSVDVQEVVRELDAQGIVDAVVARIPIPKDGLNGKDGKDGVGVAGAIIDRNGQLVITKSDGSVQDLGIVVGRDGAQGAPGKDGIPGRDGFGFDDMESIEDNLRFGHRFRRGDDVKEFWWNKATLADFDHEIWKSGMTYPRGAVVTTGGSLFICKKQTNEKPGLSKDWRLAVKCGRNGDDGKVGPMGPPGNPGKDGRMVGFDGRAL